MKRVVIVGASGFIGSALSERLTLLDYDVIPVSRQKRSGFIEPKDIKSFSTSDVVIHLGEESDRTRVAELGTLYALKCYSFVDQLIEAFRGRVIYASSAVVYGDQNSKASREQDAVSATDLYSEIKIRNERKVIDAGGIALRISNIYGAAMPPNNVISDILKQLEGSEPVFLRDTTPLRDFLDLGSLCSLVEVILSDFTPGLYNAGSGISTSIGDIAKKIISVSNYSDKAVIGRNSPSRESVNYLDISKAKEVFNWSPNNDFNENLSYIIKSI